MFWILLVMGLLVAVVAALVIGGIVTPRTHVASRSVTVPGDVETVWRVIRDVRAYASWRPELLESVASIGDEGEEWREATRGQSVRFGVTADEPPHRFAARILDDDLPYSGEWTWELAPASVDTTRVTVTERGEVGNPVFRFIGAHLIGHTATIDNYLRALAIRLGSATAAITDGAR